MTNKRKIVRGERIEMTVKMQVTEAQALTLQAMFNHWNFLARIGGSRMVGFYVDGDGNFKPKCEVSFSEPICELDDELTKLSGQLDNNRNLNFDFDSIAWKLLERDDE